jgi:hypothetical protein
MCFVFVIARLQQQQQAQMQVPPLPLLHLLLKVLLYQLLQPLPLHQQMPNQPY